MKLSSTCFEQIIVLRQDICTSSLQFFNMHSMRSLVADNIRLILGLDSGNVGLYNNNNNNNNNNNMTFPLPRNSMNRIVSTARLLIRCMVKYYKLLVHIS